MSSQQLSFSPPFTPILSVVRPAPCWLTPAHTGKAPIINSETTYRNILITYEEKLTKCTYFSVSRSLTKEKETKKETYSVKQCAISKVETWEDERRQEEGAPSVTDRKERKNKREIDRRAREIEYMQEEKVIKVDCGPEGEGSCLREWKRKITSERREKRERLGETDTQSLWLVLEPA